MSQIFIFDGNGEYNYVKIINQADCAIGFAQIEGKMINIFVNGIKMQVNEGTRVIDLLKQEDRRKYAVCKLGSQIKELNRKLSSKDDGKTIEF